MKFFEVTLVVLMILGSLNTADAKQVVKGKKMEQGFHLTEVVPGSVYDRMGLKPGDTLVAYNGHSFKEAKDMADFLGLLHKPGPINLLIERDGKTLPINYVVKAGE